MATSTRKRGRDPSPKAKPVVTEDTYTDGTPIPVNDNGWPYMFLDYFQDKPGRTIADLISHGQKLSGHPVHDRCFQSEVEDVLAEIAAEVRRTEDAQAFKDIYLFAEQNDIWVNESKLWRGAYCEALNEHNEHGMTVAKFIEDRAEDPIDKYHL